MQSVQTVHRQSAAPDTDVFSTALPVPGLGVLPANAFLIRAKEPVLVDAGVVALASDFLDAILHAIEPQDLRYIWLTHADPDHIGCLHRLLELAPRARVVTNFLGLGKLGLSRAVPPERAYLINPGQALDLGDRTLWAVKPPSYDAPETTGLFDGKTRTLFSADCFGAVLSEAPASARDIPPGALAEGAATWGQIDTPWLSHLTDTHYHKAVDVLQRLKPEHVLSSHLPPARGMVDQLLQALDHCRRAAPFVGPDQAAMQQVSLST